MFESILNFFRKFGKNEIKEATGSKNMAKERLHLVLMQDRANVSADFLEMMKQEIIEVIKKYIEVDEKEIDVRLTNEVKEDGTTGAPSLYANIPIVNIRNDMKKEVEEEAKNNKTGASEQEEQKEENEKVSVKIENKEEKKNIEKKADNEEPIDTEKEEIKKESTKKSTVKKTTTKKTAVKKA